MSVLAERALALGKPAGSVPYSLWVPLWGAAWVTTNVALIAAGTQFRFPVTCSFLAGLINGTVLSVVVVAIASERLKAGATGLLGGISLSGLRSDGSMIWKTMQAVHGFIDDLMRNGGVPGSERMHQSLEEGLLYMIWTTVLVMMASLAAEWIITTRLQRANERVQ
jgi:hypothetical protein